MVEVAPRRPARAASRGRGVDFVHTGPGTIAGRYLRLFWHPVARSMDLTAGRLKPVRIMSEDFTLYRGEVPSSEPRVPSAKSGSGTWNSQLGTPHLVAFRCAHRGTQLSAGWVVGDNLRCFYHGWMYDPSGQCIEQPGESEPFCGKIRIRSFPTHEYMGLVFAYLGDGVPPPPPRATALERAEGVLENWCEEWACNYFNRLENAGDLMHVPFVHRHHGGSIPVRIESHETPYGIETRSRANDEDWSRPTRFHMPNMNYFVGNTKAKEIEVGPRHNFMWRVPVDDERHLVFGAERVQVRPGDEERYRAWQKRTEEDEQREPMDLVARWVLAGTVPNSYVHETRKWDTSSAQDYVALMGQGVIADREHEHLGREDAGIILLRKIYERELRALAQGRPIKQWRWEDEGDIQ